MNDFQKQVFKIIKSAVTGEKYTLPKDFDLKSAFALAKKHSIIPIFYYGILNSDINQDTPEIQQMFILTCKHISINEQQMYEIGRILDAFDQNGIEYMPLKGTVLKKLYPKPEMRIMSDADILIKTEQYEKTGEIVKSLGYEEVGESDHELIWHKDIMHIELHKRLIPSYNKDYYAYFGDGWRLAKLKDGTRYSMTNDDNMIYLLTHFAKHYRDAGIGIKHLYDLWVYRRSIGAFDEEYIVAEMKKLKLDVFYQNVLKTIDACFADGENSEITDAITDTVINSGTYGTHKAHLFSAALKTTKTTGSVKTVRIKNLLHTVFLPYKSMCQKYEFLEKVPVLLPVMWICRIFDVILHKQDKIKLHKDEFDLITDENINGYQAALNFVGLDYNFKE